MHIVSSKMLSLDILFTFPIFDQCCSIAPAAEALEPFIKSVTGIKCQRQHHVRVIAHLSRIRPIDFILSRHC